MIITATFNDLTRREQHFMVEYCRISNLVVSEAQGAWNVTGEYTFVNRLGAYLNESARKRILAGDRLGISRTELAELSGSEFEEVLARLFRGQGYSVELTKKTGDHGIDLKLRRDGEHIVVQCKRWKRKIGEPIVRDFYGALVSSGAKSGYIISTASFSVQATEFAKNKPIKLLNMDDLLELFG